MRKINKIIVHCSATPPDRDIGAEEIDQWHKERGWSGIGYHFVLRRKGTLEEGRPVLKVGAHVRGHNRDSIGICLVGGVDDNLDPQDNFTAKQKENLRILIKGIKAFVGNDAEILGHNNLDSNKSCPCFDVPKWWETGSTLWK